MEAKATGAQWLRWPVFGYEVGRSLQYKLQSTILHSLERLLPGIESVERPTPEIIRIASKHLFDLLKADADRIAAGVYPLSVLRPESPIEHFKRIPRIILDGYRIGRKRRTGRTTEFSPKIAEQLESLPKYYRRTFHFQTDGYLSAESADLYEHEVELLFAGSADPMRRIGIAPLKNALESQDGAGKKILEIASGTGRATRFLAESFPKARIIANDLSAPYLLHAREQLKGCGNVDFLQAPAEGLPFSDSQFDAVTSVFLFHELPEEVRVDVLRESFRVVREGGIVSYVDSIQKGDLPEYDEALQQFPADFHEPFYRNYVETPMDSLFLRAADAAGVTVEKIGLTEIGFTSRSETFRCVMKA